jgi:Fe-S-cluster-containing hydrogenase component 2
MEAPVVNLTIDVHKCTACRACELACSFTKEGVFSPSLSRIRVMQLFDAGLNIPVVCTNCADAPCIPACPRGAIYRDPTVPVVRVNEQQCTGCGECLQACPFGAVDRPAGRKSVIMCDLCDGSPACVKSCVYGALVFLAKPATAEEKRWGWARTIAKRVRK